MSTNLPRNIGPSYPANKNSTTNQESMTKSQSDSTNLKPSIKSSTFDAFMRMQAGLDGRKLADKIADTNRPTWEQYKKDNEDKLDGIAGDTKKMVEYREQLDNERELRLKAGRDKLKRSEMDSSSDSDDSDVSSENDESNQKKKKHDNKRHKKSNKKEKKSHKKKKHKHEKIEK